MRIAITHPTCWPFVRRGAERFMEDLRGYLLKKGHFATALANGIQSAPRASPLAYIPKRFQQLTGYSFIQPLRATLREQKFDIVQSLHFTDGYAAVLEARRAGHRTCFYVTGPPIPAALRRIPPDRWMVRQAITRADKVVVPSKYVRDIVRQFYDRDAAILPVPIDVEWFCPGGEYLDAPPVILCVAAFDDRRKGIRPLIGAFNLLRKRIPDLRLVLSGQMGAELRQEIEALLPASSGSAVDFAGVGRLEDLPALYRSASVTVLPSKWESYSLVLLESWACGCPVVAAAHGALPELVTDPRIGVLFDPGSDGVEVQDVNALAAAIEKGLELRSQANLAELCRSKARQFAWERLGPDFETMYEKLCPGM